MRPIGVRLWSAAPTPIRISVGALVAQAVLPLPLFALAVVTRDPSAPGPGLLSALPFLLLATLMVLGLALWLLRGSAVAWLLVVTIAGLMGLVARPESSLAESALTVVVAAVTVLPLLTPEGFRWCWRRAGAPAGPPPPRRPDDAW